MDSFLELANKIRQLEEQSTHKVWRGFGTTGSIVRDYDGGFGFKCLTESEAELGCLLRNNIKQIVEALESMNCTSLAISQPENETPVDPDTLIDSSIVEKTAWTRKEIEEIIEETILEGIEQHKPDLGPNTTIQFGKKTIL